MARRYGSTTAWEWPQEDETPGVQHVLSVTPAGSTVADGVALAFLALLGSLTIWGVGLLATVAVRWELAATWRWVLAAGLIPWGLLALASLRLLVAHFNAALERILGVDLDDSGEIGDVPQVRVEITDYPQRAVRFLDLDVDEGQLARLTRLALAGRLSERDVSAVMSRRQWGELRQRLLDGGYLAWRNPSEPRSGLVLTPAGRALFQHLAERYR